MQYLISSDELNVQFQSTDFVLKTQRQIAKDFAVCGIDFEESFLQEEKTLPIILDNTNSKLEEIMNQGETSTLQLLYQIDIPQQDFLSLTTDPEFLSKMSELIVKREAYKVYLRSKF